MYALMKANLFVHFPGHVIKYQGFSKRRKKTIDEYLNLQQEGWQSNDSVVLESIKALSQLGCMQYDQKYIFAKKANLWKYGNKLVNSNTMWWVLKKIVYCG